MESKHELKATDIKNHTCYYFDCVIREIVIDFDILLEEKSYKNKYENI